MLTMLDYIKKEKEINTHILESESLFSNLVSIKSNYRDIVIYATGSSSNAAQSAVLFMQEVLQIPIYIKEPSIALNYENQWDSQTLYLAISQGGSSYSTIEVVKYLQANEIDVYVLTSNTSSPIAQVAHHVIDLQMGIETMPYVTAGYTATILVLWILALELALRTQIITEEDYVGYRNSIQATVNQADKVIAMSDSWYDKFKDQILNKKRFVFIGYGACYGVAKEAETKFMETLHIPAHGHELEEYMHGPYLGLNKDDFLVLIDPNGKLTSRMSLLREFLDLHMTTTYKFSMQDANDQEQDLSFGIDIPELLTPLIHTIPFHMISYYISKEHGTNLHESYYPEFDEITGSKI